jgi:hypothetical protein
VNGIPIVWTRQKGKSDNKRKGQDSAKDQCDPPKRQRQQQTPQAHAVTEQEDPTPGLAHQNGWEDEEPQTAMAVLCIVSEFSLVRC